MPEPQCPSVPRGLPRTAPGARTARAAASLAAALLALWSCTGTAVAVDGPTQPKRLTLFSTASGAALADEKGNPLYLRKADKPNTPGCKDGCAKVFFAAVGFPKKERGVTGTVSHTPHHAPGSRLPQVIFNKHPLYYYKHDHPKQPKGQHVPGFSLVAPDGTPLAPPSGHAAKERGQIGVATSRPESPATRPQGRSTAAPRKHSAPAHTPAPHPATRHPATGHATTHHAVSRPATPHPTTAHQAAPHKAHPTTTHHTAPRKATPHPTATHHSTKHPPTTHPGTPRPAITHPPAHPVVPATTTPGTAPAASAPATSSAPAASASAAVGALQITPSGAASGGAAYPATADTSVATSATKISLAIGGTSAAAAGATLIIRRLRRRAVGGEH